MSPNLENVFMTSLYVYTRKPSDFIGFQCVDMAPTPELSYPPTFPPDRTTCLFLFKLKVGITRQVH